MVLTSGQDKAEGANGVSDRPENSERQVLMGKQGTGRGSAPLMVRECEKSAVSLKTLDSLAPVNPRN